MSQAHPAAKLLNKLLKGEVITVEGEEYRWYNEGDKFTDGTGEYTTVLTGIFKKHRVEQGSRFSFRWFHYSDSIRTLLRLTK